MKLTRIERMSYSTAQSYADCSEKVRLDKIHRVPRIPMWAGIGGSAVHTVTENLDRRDFGIPLPDDAPLTFEDAFLEEVERAKGKSDLPPEGWYRSGRASKALPNKEDASWWLANGQSFVDNWRFFVQTSPWQIWITPTGDPAIELAIEWEVNGIPVVGYIDRIMEHVTEHMLAIIDLKSGSRDPSSATQLKFYAQGVEHLLGVRPTYGGYFMVRKGQLLPLTPLGYDDKYVSNIITQAARGIEQGIFLPHPSNLCGSCGVRRHCATFGGELAGEIPQNEAAVWPTEE